MPTFRIYEETDNDGLFQRAQSIFCSRRREALKPSLPMAQASRPYKRVSASLSCEIGAEPTYCYLFKLVAPPQTWDVVSA
jgi:hypothetical protein